MMNENAITNLLLDVDFLDEELKRNGHSHSAAFAELRSVCHLPCPGPPARLSLSRSLAAALRPFSLAPEFSP